MSFLDSQEMYTQLSADIEGATSIRDLYSLMELILPLPILKKVLKDSLVKHLQNTQPTPPSKKSPTPKTESLRNVYFSVSSIERVFPEAIHVKIISYLQRKEFPNISLLSKTYKRWMTDYSILYNEKNVRKLTPPPPSFFHPHPPQQKKPIRSIN